MSKQEISHHFRRALEIKQTLGLTRAAGYMRNRGFGPEVAAIVLARKEIIA